MPSFDLGSSVPVALSKVFGVCRSESWTQSQEVSVDMNSLEQERMPVATANFKKCCVPRTTTYDGSDHAPNMVSVMPQPVRAPFLSDRNYREARVVFQSCEGHATVTLFDRPRGRVIGEVPSGSTGAIYGDFSEGLVDQFYRVCGQGRFLSSMRYDNLEGWADVQNLLVSGVERAPPSPERKVTFDSEAAASPKRSARCDGPDSTSKAAATKSSTSSETTSDSADSTAAEQGEMEKNHEGARPDDISSSKSCEEPALPSDSGSFKFVKKEDTTDLPLPPSEPAVTSTLSTASLHEAAAAESSPEVTRPSTDKCREVKSIWTQGSSDLQASSFPTDADSWQQFGRAVGSSSCAAPYGSANLQSETDAESWQQLGRAVGSIPCTAVDNRLSELRTKSIDFFVPVGSDQNGTLCVVTNAAATSSNGHNRALQPHGSCPAPSAEAQDDASIQKSSKPAAISGEKQSSEGNLRLLGDPYVGACFAFVAQFCSPGQSKASNLVHGENVVAALSVQRAETQTVHPNADAPNQRLREESESKEEHTTVVQTASSEPRLSETNGRTEAIVPSQDDLASSACDALSRPADLDSFPGKWVLLDDCTVADEFAPSARQSQPDASPACASNAPCAWAIVKDTSPDSLIFTSIGSAGAACMEEVAIGRRPDGQSTSGLNKKCAAVWRDDGNVRKLVISRAMQGGQNGQLHCEEERYIESDLLHFRWVEVSSAFGQKVLYTHSYKKQSEVQEIVV